LAQTHDNCVILCNNIFKQNAHQMLR